MVKLAGPGNVASINYLLRSHGRRERLVRGKGYFYLSGGDAPTWHTSGIYGANIRYMSLPQAIRAVELVYENAGIKLKLAEWYTGNPLC